MIKITLTSVTQTASRKQVLPVKRQIRLNCFGVVVLNFVVRSETKKSLTKCTFSTRECKQRIAQSLHGRLSRPSNLSAFAQAVCPASRPSYSMLNEEFRLSRTYELNQEMAYLSYLLAFVFEGRSLVGSIFDCREAINESLKATAGATT
jgi:hypothetical protein